MSKTETKVPWSVKKEKVGPKEAEKFLKSMVKNRHPSPSHVTMMAKMMSSDQWLDNGETIVIDWFNHMLDGQHRCLAVIESGKTVLMTIVRGVNPETFASFNNVRPRSGGDVLRMMGYSSSSVHAAAIKLVVLFDEGDMMNHRNKKLSNIQMQELAGQFPGMADSVLRGLRCKQILPGSAAAALHYICARVCRDTADLFFESLSTGSMLKEDDPIFKLRSWGIGQMKKRHGDEISRAELFTTVIHAWNLVRQGKTCKKFIVNYSPGDQLPKPL